MTRSGAPGAKLACLQGHFLPCGGDSSGWCEASAKSLRWCFRSQRLPRPTAGNNAKRSRMSDDTAKIRLVSGQLVMRFAWRNALPLGRGGAGVTHDGAKATEGGVVAAQPTETGVAPAPPLTPKQGSIRHVAGRMARVEGL